MKKWEEYKAMIDKGMAKAKEKGVTFENDLEYHAIRCCAMMMADEINQWTIKDMLYMINSKQGMIHVCNDVIQAKEQIEYMFEGFDEIDHVDCWDCIEQTVNDYFGVEIGVEI